MKHINKPQFIDPVVDEQFANVSRYYDVTRRAAPEPYFPAKDQLLNESELMRKIDVLHPKKDLSIYLHIPFCDGKCRFCDLYSFHVPIKYRRIIEHYLQNLIAEIRLWGKRFAWKRNRVTTVHLGGGSPLILTPDQLRRLFSELRRHFNIDTDTELAVEITSSDISEQTIQLFHELNIRRIHVGIQTLRDDLREFIGRRENAKTVESKIKLLVRDEFITSADILYGIPGQDFDDVRSDISFLIENGLDGFALYELQISRVLDKIIRKNPELIPDKLKSYQMVLMGKKFLNEAGYQNVFFNHYGNHRDKNLYFTFPARNEDCLAFGTIADGLIGPLFYRHLPLKKYNDAIKSGSPGIDFAFAEDDQRITIRAFESYLMATRIPESAIETMINTFGHSFHGIWDMWVAAGLVEKTDGTPDYALTGNGCWLLSTMMERLRQLH
jgi:oxygen-independent coproporphyrinogen-3 oxidase